jgi:hypothetical protein
MVKNHDEFMEPDEGGEEEFDFDEYLSLLDGELSALVEPLGIDSIWVVRHDLGIAIHFDTPLITNGPNPDQIADARLAIWQGPIPPDYDSVDEIAQAIFLMLKDGLTPGS